MLQGGHGNHKIRSDGRTVGGSVILNAGQSLGREFDDKGGDVDLTAGYAKWGDGGDVNIESGSSNDKTSGSVYLSTPDAGRSGESGDMFMTTGESTASYENWRSKNNDIGGNSGSIGLETGGAQGIGRGGDITLRVGTAIHSDGGAVKITAGNATGTSYVGGTLDLHSGSGEYCYVFEKSSISLQRTYARYFLQGTS